MTAVPDTGNPLQQSSAQDSSTSDDRASWRDALRPRRLLKDTPGRLTLALVALLILISASGAAAVADTSSRFTTIDEASGQRGRMAIAAFEMYRALSDADGAVTSTFLPGRTSSAELGESYADGISRASAAITTLSQQANTNEQATIVAELSAALPVYTGMVETARTYHRQDQPLGLAYLRNASALAQEDMLPKLRDLQSASMEDLSGAKDSATAFPWAATAALLLAIGALGYCQVRLSKRTNRVINPGMAAATLALLIATGWLVFSWVSASGHVNDGYRNGTEPLAALSQAHIDAQRARSDEALTLIAQGGGTDYEAEYAELMDGLVGDDGILTSAVDDFDDPQLSRHVEDAVDAATEWQEAHKQLRAADDNGDFDSAVESASSTQDGTAGAAFAKLNTSLTEANSMAAKEFNSRTDDAASSLMGSSAGIAVLSVAAMIAAAAGVQRRISEYR